MCDILFWSPGPPPLPPLIPEGRKVRVCEGEERGERDGAGGGEEVKPDI